ncbi:MAG: SAM hydroxide adenosyltransferase [Candidatus Micrarchaeota archaeon]
MTRGSLRIYGFVRKGIEQAKAAASAGRQRMRAAAIAFRKPSLLEQQTETKKATIVLATDWGADGAETNIESQIEALSSGLGMDVSIKRIPGFAPLSSPLPCAVELDRIITTHRITSELLVRTLRNEGLPDGEIRKRLSLLTLVNVFDRKVGSGRVAGIVKGYMPLLDGEFTIQVNLIGPLNNGIIRALSRRLRDCQCHELANPEFQVDELGCKTWDGRAKFGPAAVFSSYGISPSEFGPGIDLGAFPEISFRASMDGTIAEVPVVTVDEIGNLVTGIDNGSLGGLGEILSLSGPHGSLLARKGEKFDDVPEGEAVFYAGSKGLIEVAVNMGSAAESLGIGPGSLELDGGESALILRAKNMGSITVAA